MRARPEPGDYRPCKQCGEPVYSTTGRRKHGTKGTGNYCSKKCYGDSLRKGEYQNCEHCGSEFYAHRRTINMGFGKFCSQRCDGASRTEPTNGNRYVCADGYVMVKLDKGVCRAEHRIVMERHLGRTLARDEHVHHVNGDKQNNRLDNLQVLSAAEHCRLHHTRYAA